MQTRISLISGMCFACAHVHSGKCTAPVRRGDNEEECGCEVFIPMPEGSHTDIMLVTIVPAATTTRTLLTA